VRRRTCRGGSRFQCAYRTQGYPCPAGSDPLATLGQHFQPLFLYESLSGFLGMIVLIWLARRLKGRLLAGDLLLVFFIWYGSVRFVLESFKADNWVVLGVPTAQLVAGASVVGAAAILVTRHVRRPRQPVHVRPDTGQAAATGEMAHD
jgi:prolipoprotein diacylglyceryltransferase